MGVQGAGIGFKIVAWNCRGGFSRKAKYLFDLDPDVAVVSEVSKRDAEAISDGHVVWDGVKGSKGIALVGRNGWLLRPVFSHSEKHVVAALAIRREVEIVIVGVWAMPVKRDYVGPFLRALEDVRPHLRGDVLIAGDFNANLIWDAGRGSERRFATAISRLETLGLSSIWHSHSGEGMGSEVTPTFFLHFQESRAYHLDYVFASRGIASRLKSVTIGAHADWVSTTLSDHVPVIADFAL